MDASAAALLVTFDGRGSIDTLLGPATSSTWSITGAGGGTLNGHVGFSSIENVTGAADNDDTFIVAAAGAISGVVDGGNAGFDTLVIQGGTYDTVTFTASNRSAGSVVLDNRVIAYAGLEPITLGGDVANAVIDLSPLDLPSIPLYSPDEATLKAHAGVPGELTFESSSPIATFETLHFPNPHNSLTIRLGGGNDILHIDTLDAQFAASLAVEGNRGDDAVFMEKNLSLPGANLSIDAETIGVGFAIGRPSEAKGWTANATYEDVVPSGTSGAGSGMQVDIVVDDHGVPAVMPRLRGDDYQLGDSITFHDPGGAGDPVTLRVLSPGDLGVTVSTRSAVDDAGTIQFGGFNHADVNHVTYDGEVAVSTDEIVLIADPFLINRFTGIGDVGSLYQYVGGVSPRTIDLCAEDFTDASQWDDLGPAVSLAQMARNIIVGQHSQFATKRPVPWGPETCDWRSKRWPAPTRSTCSWQTRTGVTSASRFWGAPRFMAGMWYSKPPRTIRIIDGEGAGHAIFNGLLGFVESLDLIGGVAISKTDACIEIAQGSAIHADQFQAIAEATSNAYTAPIALTAAVAVAVADTRAHVTVAGSITTTGDVYIRAGADNTLDARADAGALLADTAVGVAVTVLDSHATASVTDDAVLHVGRDLVVHADTVNRNVTLAQSTAGPDGLLGVATAVSDEESYTNAFLDGQATVTGSVTVESLHRKEAIEDAHCTWFLPSSPVSPPPPVSARTRKVTCWMTPRGLVSTGCSRNSRHSSKANPISNSRRARTRRTRSTRSTCLPVWRWSIVPAPLPPGSATAKGMRGVATALSGSIDVHAKVESRPDITAGSASATPTGQQPSVQGNDPTKPARFGGSAAVAVGDYDNTARAYVGAGAQVDARQQLGIKAEASNDYEFEWFTNLLPENFANPEIDYTTAQGAVQVEQGNVVRVVDGFVGTGTIGHAYQYVGNTPLNVDLSAEDFTDDGRWADEEAMSVDHYSADGSAVVQDGDLVRVSKGHAAGGDAPEIYRYVGSTPGATIDLRRGGLLGHGHLGKPGSCAWKSRSLAFVQNLTSYLNDNLGLDDNAVDSWSQSTADATDLSVAGSVTVLSLDQIAEAYIDQDALVNQNTTDVPRTVEQDQDVVVVALSVDEAVHLAGNIELPGLAGHQETDHQSIVRRSGHAEWEGCRGGDGLDPHA